VAADAIARQYDVDKNSVNLFCEPGKGSYRPGTITFVAKKGASIDLDKIRESITATRLSGGTNMSVDYLEITATGGISLGDEEVVLKGSKSGPVFVLKDDPKAKGIVKKLRQAGDKVASVTGLVQGWNGRFPVMLQALAKTSGQDRFQLFVTGFETAKK
jgi:hypothetical protein